MFEKILFRIATKLVQFGERSYQIFPFLLRIEEKKIVI